MSDAENRLYVVKRVMASSSGACPSEKRQPSIIELDDAAPKFWWLELGGIWDSHANLDKWPIAFLSEMKSSSSSGDTRIFALHSDMRAWILSGNRSSRGSGKLGLSNSTKFSGRSAITDGRVFALIVQWTLIWAWKWSFLRARVSGYGALYL